MVVSKTRYASLDAGLKLAETDLSIPLLRTLIAVSMNTHLSVTDLAELINVPQQTASRYVALLQGRYQSSESSSSFARGPLLTTNPSSSDLRRYELVLTPRGSARLEAILNQIYSKGASE
jgi:DNA-binding MarR family transcriptional regulator